MPSLAFLVVSAIMSDDQNHGGFARGEDEINEVLSELSFEYHLEDHLSPLTLMTSMGGGSFKDDVLRESLSSPRCLVCHRFKETWSGEPRCDSCKSIWNGLLAVKQFRFNVRHMNHWKVRNCKI